MRVEAAITVRCRPSELWEVVADPSCYEELSNGVTRWRRSGRARAVGAGARYSMRMRVGSADVGGLVEIVECDPCRDLAWTGVTGIDQRGRWRLREVHPGRTRVLLLPAEAEDRR